jgi:chromosome segregation ATPase
MDQPWVFIVLFGLVFIVYAKIIPKTSAAKGQANPTLHDIEETMEHFTAELEEQNKALIQMLAETKRDYEVQVAKLSSRVETLEKQSTQTSQEISKLGYAYEELQKKAIHRADLTPILESKTSMAVVGKDVQEQEPEPLIAMNLKTRYAELFALYEQGKSTEYIAKKLNMNKGEINLIFQLAKQEEKLSAY